MRRRNLFIYIVLSIILIITPYGCIQQQSTASNYETELKVMSFNIRYGTANDGENRWDLRKEFLFEVIRENNPDIIGLQEALEYQLQEIIENIPGYGFIGSGRDDGKSKGEFSAILFAKDRFIIDTSETFWFSDQPQVPGSITWGGSLPRICTWGLIFDKFTNKSLYVYNIHWDHQSQISREKSSEALLEKIGLNDKNIPLVLTGDFNCGDANPGIRKLLDAGLTDTYRALNSKSPDEGTFNGFKGDKSGEKIDFIFIRGNFEIVSSAIDHSNRNGRYPSDHFPVTATLKYK